MKKNLLLLSILCSAATLQAQVGINTQEPKATLDVIGNPQDTSKFDGVIAPRITGDQLRAKSYTTSQIGAMVYVTIADTAPAGQTADVTAKGYYYFDGTKWVRLSNSSPNVSVDPSVVGFNCGSARLVPSTYTQGQPYNGFMYIPYAGGNGSPYAAGTPINSTGVTGLTATLQPGTLSSGNGELLYKVTGTPSASSPQTANFAINEFGKTCTTSTLGVSSTVIQTLGSGGGNYKYTNENNMEGYEVVATTPDGKISIRAFIPKGYAWSESYTRAFAQIRNNTSTPLNVAFKNYNHTNSASLPLNKGYSIDSSAGFPLPPGSWYGLITYATTFLPHSNDYPSVSISNALYYNTSPAIIYIQVEDPNSPEKFLIYKIMLFIKDKVEVANDTNCPNGVCPNQAVLFTIEQYNQQ